VASSIGLGDHPENEVDRGMDSRPGRTDDGECELHIAT
jgi:hypothetical protein